MTMPASPFIFLNSVAEFSSMDAAESARAEATEAAKRVVAGLNRVPPPLTTPGSIRPKLMRSCTVTALLPALAAVTPGSTTPPEPPGVNLPVDGLQVMHPPPAVARFPRPLVQSQPLRNGLRNPVRGWRSKTHI